MDRGKATSKRYFVSDRGGVPLAVVLSAANIRDSKVFEELIDAVEPIALPGRGRPRKRPAKLHVDKGYDFPVAERRCATAASRRASPRGVRHTDERLGRYRWVGGTYSGVAGPLPQVFGALREAVRHPRGVPTSWLLTHLPQLPLVRFCNAH
jgi:hypothetical protein